MHKSPVIQPAFLQSPVPPTASAPANGFGDPIFDSQRVFRTVLDCLARPGRPARLDCSVAAPAPLLSPTACVLLALADFETAIWLDDTLANNGDVAAFLRFHTGAKITRDPGQATFAVVNNLASMPPLSAFAQGTPDYPDTATTLLVQVEHLVSQGHTFEGPGIDGRISFSVAPPFQDFTRQLDDNRASFPCGVDLIFVTPSAIAALPRSTRRVKG